MGRALANLGLAILVLAVGSSCGNMPAPTHSPSTNVTVLVPQRDDDQSFTDAAYPLENPGKNLQDGDLYGVPVLVNGKYDSHVLYFDSSVGPFGAFRSTTRSFLISKTGKVSLTAISGLEATVTRRNAPGWVQR